MNRKAQHTQIETNHKISRTKSKSMKLYGSGILLFAFFTQQFLVFHYTTKVDEFFRGYQVYSNAYTSSQIYEVLFYSQALATGVSDGNVLKKGALDNISGLSVEIAGSSLQNEEKQRAISALFEAANKVHDMNSYNEFKNILNKEEQSFIENTFNDMANVKYLKKVAGFVYIFLYFIGSSLVLVAIKLE